MTDRKSIKRALIASVIAILLCCAMLVGTTFAWFTDMISTGRNIIKSGNLDAELMYDFWDAGSNAWSGDWQSVDESTIVFENELWEPGATEVVRFKVVNAGSLAFKYELGIQVVAETTSTNVFNEVLKLSDHILVGATGETIASRADAAAIADANIWESTNLLAEDGVQTLLASDGTAESAEIWTLAIHMPTTVGNEANHIGDAPTIEFGVVLIATQLTEETDDFGIDYDADATYGIEVTNAEDLKALLANNSNVTAKIPEGASIELTLEETEKLEQPVEGKPAIINYGTLSVEGGTIVNEATGKQGGAVVQNYGTLSLKNVNVGSSLNRGAAVQNNGGTVEVDGGTFEVIDRSHGGAFGNGDAFAYVFINNGGTMTIKNATSVGRPNGVFYCGAGTINVESGTYTIEEGANTWYMAYAGDGATINLNGGTFNWAKGPYCDAATIGNVVLASGVEITQTN